MSPIGKGLLLGMAGSLIVFALIWIMALCYQANETDRQVRLLQRDQHRDESDISRLQSDVNRLLHEKRKAEDAQ